MTQSQQQNVPALRFPEFSDEWEEKLLGKLFSKIRNGFVGTATPYYQKIGIKYLQGKNVKNGGIDPKGMINISEEFHEWQKKSQLKSGDILMVQSGHVGECAVVTNEYDGANCHALVVMSPTEKISSIFVRNLFYTSAGLRLIQKIKTGNTIAHILTSDLKQLAIDVPSTLPEQKKIATFLSAVDERIEQLTRKRALLEQYKKGMMQKLFSQELRFKDKNGTPFPDWEDKKLGDVLIIGSGRDYKHLATGDVPVYGTGGHMTFVNDFLYDGESVCIGRKGTIDKPMYLNEKFWTVDTLFYTHSFKDAIPKFIYAVFQTINWKKHNEASGVPSLSKTIIEKIKVSMPVPKEQQKIANFLSSIDDKINLTATELTQAQVFKKGLLQQMFV